jgi:proteasome lid subunit RPN8/RPN11
MLKIAKWIHDDIISHARAGFPLEVCGILGGVAGEVSAIYPMTNTDQSNEHFMMDPREQFSVIKQLRGRGLEMLAVYHSHPETPARPSEEDIRLALTPGISYIIASLAEPERPVVNSFRINGGSVQVETLEII